MRAATHSSRQKRASGDTPLPGHLSRVCERDSSGSIIGHCDRINIGGA